MPLSGGTVPIVPAAVIFDLPVGAWKNRPDTEFGYRAAELADDAPEWGAVGAGAGARAGTLKGGVGSASVNVGDGIVVGALVVADPVGLVINPATGRPWTADILPELSAPPAAEIEKLRDLPDKSVSLNTTIGVVATNAALSKAQCRRVAIAAHDGLARAIRPAHTPMDGDTLYVLATERARAMPIRSPPRWVSPPPTVSSEPWCARWWAPRAWPEYPHIVTCCQERFRNGPSGPRRQEGPLVLRIRADLVDAMVKHARADHPDEACGVLAGPEGSDRAERHVAMINAERSPTFYRFDSGEQLRVWREMDDADEVPVVIYHSHTATEAYPSRTDISLAAEPDAHYVLVSTRDPERHELRSYRIIDGVVTEEDITIVEQY